MNEFLAPKQNFLFHELVIFIKGLCTTSIKRLIHDMNRAFHIYGIINFVTVCLLKTDFGVENTTYYILKVMITTQVSFVSYLGTKWEIQKYM